MRSCEEICSIEDLHNTPGNPGTLIDACHILASQGHAINTAGQVSCRNEMGVGWWTTRLGSGFGEITSDDLLLIDDNMVVLEGNGKPNPAVRFHLWVYRNRPDIKAIVHTHPPAITAFSMLGKPLPIAHMDSCMFYNDCGFLARWPGVPFGDEEGRLISEALGELHAAILVNHGHICVGSSIEDTVYRAISLEHAADAVLRAMAAGTIQEIDPDLAIEGRRVLMLPSIVNDSFAYWTRLAKQKKFPYKNLAT